MDVFLNGRFVSRQDARLSAFDTGVQHAIGLFETLLARNGEVFRPRYHVDRLIASARELNLVEGMHPTPLVDAIQATVERNKLRAARVRLTVTAGDMAASPGAASSGSGHAGPTLLIVAQPPTPYPDAYFEEGVAVTIASGRLALGDPLAGYKTLSYWARIRELQRAGQAGAGECLWFTSTSRLASGSVSNAFIVSGGRLLTPPARPETPPGELAWPVLPGITRSAIIELATDRGIEVERQPLTVDDCLRADEIFLTNSSWGVLPVVAIESNTIGAGTPGPLTRTLRQAWLDLVESETASGPTSEATSSLDADPEPDAEMGG